MPGETAYIYNIEKNELQRRLCELGMVGGTRVTCVAASPLGGASAYLVRGAVIALRKPDARTVSVQRIPCSEKWD